MSHVTITSVPHSLVYSFFFADYGPARVPSLLWLVKLWSLPAILHCRQGWQYSKRASSVFILVPSWRLMWKGYIVVPDLAILASYAHPDDEQGVTGTLAWYAEQGVRTGLICADRKSTRLNSSHVKIS